MDRKIDYDTIFAFYEVRRKPGKEGENEIRALRKVISERLEKYLARMNLSDKEWPQIPENYRNIFVYIKIKDRMLKGKDEKFKQKIQKKIDDCLLDDAEKGSILFTRRNAAIKNFLYKDDYIAKDASVSEKKNAYKDFCQNWQDYNKWIDPPSYNDFVKNPNLSIYDYMMNEIENESMFDSAINDVVLRIVVKVLEDKFGLKIDYAGIKECFQTFYEINQEEDFDLSLFDTEPFPETFEEFKSMVTESIGEQDETDIKEEKAEGDMQAEKAEGDMQAEKAEGDMQAEKAEGDIQAEKAEGDIQAEKAEGDMQAEKAEGDIQAEKAEGDIQAEKAEGDIQAEKAEGDIQAEKAEGDIKEEKKGDEPKSENPLNDDELKRNYEKMRTMLAKSMQCIDKLHNIENFYTIE